MPLTPARTGAELARLAPSELIVSETQEESLRETATDLGLPLTPLGQASFDSTAAEKRLCDLFAVRTFQIFLYGFDAFHVFVRILPGEGLGEILDGPAQGR